MTPAELSRAVLRSVRGAVEDGELSVTVPERVVVRAPALRSGAGGGGDRDGDGGREADLACNVALQVAKEARRPPREVARVLRERLVGVPGVGAVEIAGAGFLNVRLTGPARAGFVASVIAEGRGYGCARGGHGGGEHQGEGQDLGQGQDQGQPQSHGQGQGQDQGQGQPQSHSQGQDQGQSQSHGQGPVVLRAAPGVRAAVMVEALERILPAGGVGAGSTADVKRTAGTAPEVIRPRPVEGNLGDWPALTARLGPDEARWVLLRPAPHDAVRVPGRPVQRESNGRFRVQYAYARTCAMTRNARELGFVAEPGDPGDGWQGREAREVWAALAEFPGVVEAAARHRAPDRIARHLEVTADAWLRCHDVCPPLPVGEEKPSAVHRARLALAEAAGTVLANGLHLLGISTPERL
ncbi:ArgS-related anticodon-binding protein NrtL [Streptomyces sp. NPDC052496]|uniref:ArgS-related anticodon-binding protein NrtL n=1 Tax=Streptomyces sp. NPDC052496 TaxID=3154951 RepID=UPI00343DEA8A